MILRVVALGSVLCEASSFFFRSKFRSGALPLWKVGDELRGLCVVAKLLELTVANRSRHRPALSIDGHTLCFGKACDEPGEPYAHAALPELAKLGPVHLMHVVVKEIPLAFFLPLAQFPQRQSWLPRDGQRRERHCKRNVEHGLLLLASGSVLLCHGAKIHTAIVALCELHSNLKHVAHRHPLAPLRIIRILIPENMTFFR